MLPAAGVEVEGDKALIARRARRWQFDHPRPADLTQHDAVRSAASFLEEHRHLLPAGVAPATATQLAVLAVEIHDLFLGRVRDPEVVRAEVTRRTAYERGVQT